MVVVAGEMISPATSSQYNLHFSLNLSNLLSLITVSNAAGPFAHVCTKSRVLHDDIVPVLVTSSSCCSTCYGHHWANATQVVLHSMPSGWKGQVGGVVV
mgnify:CR=1 FL=1